MASQEIVHAYRHLLRHSLRAIQFSKPARFTLVPRLRLAFRKGNAADFDGQKVANTLEFLRYATAENGLEHKIVKNLLFIWWDQARGGHRRPHRKHTEKTQELETKTTAYDTFNYNLSMLNESMGMCLPVMTVRDPS